MDLFLHRDPRDRLFPIPFSKRAAAATPPLAAHPLTREEGCWPAAERSGMDWFGIANRLRTRSAAWTSRSGRSDAYELAQLLGGAGLFGLDEHRDRTLTPEAALLGLQAAHVVVRRADAALDAFVPPGPPPRPDAPTAARPDAGPGGAMSGLPEVAGPREAKSLLSRHVPLLGPEAPDAGSPLRSPQRPHGPTAAPDAITDLLYTRLQLWFFTLGIDIAYEAAEMRGTVPEQFDRSYMDLLDRLRAVDLRLWELRHAFAAVVEADPEGLRKIREVLRGLDESQRPWWLEPHAA